MTFHISEANEYLSLNFSTDTLLISSTGVADLKHRGNSLRKYSPIRLDDCGSLRILSARLHRASRRPTGDHRAARQQLKTSALVSDHMGRYKSDWLNQTEFRIGSRILDWHPIRVDFLSTALAASRRQIFQLIGKSFGRQWSPLTWHKA
jgi:hypothetical protein